MWNCEKEISHQECPQCGFLYMEFYQQNNQVRFICPDCGHEEPRQTESIKRKAKNPGLKKRLFR